MVRFNESENYYSNIDDIDIDILNEYSQNLLHHAVAKDRVEIAVDLIARGINVNQKDYNGQTPLHYAAVHRRTEIVREIINGGGDVNIRDNYGNNALWTAVFNARGNYEIVKLFTDKGGDALTKNKAGRSPLDFARQIGDKKLIEILTRSSV